MNEIPNNNPDLVMMIVGLDTDALVDTARKVAEDFPTLSTEERFVYLDQHAFSVQVPIIAWLPSADHGYKPKCPGINEAYTRGRPYRSFIFDKQTGHGIFHKTGEVVPNVETAVHDAVVDIFENGVGLLPRNVTFMYSMLDNYDVDEVLLDPVEDITIDLGDGCYFTPPVGMAIDDYSEEELADMKRRMVENNIAMNKAAEEEFGGGKSNDPEDALRAAEALEPLSSYLRHGGVTTQPSEEIKHKLSELLSSEGDGKPAE